MFKDEFSKLNQTIPEFDEKEQIRQQILNSKFAYDNRKNYCLKKNLVLRYCLTFMIIMVVFTIGLVSINTSSNIEDKKYQAEQERRALLYLGQNQNYYEQFILDSEEDNGEYSEYVDQMIKQNDEMEENKVVENIYYEVTVDYKNNETPQKIIVKKGELIFPEVKNNNGLYFLGWFIDEEEIFIAHSIIKDTYIYAKWADKKEITLDSIKYEYYEDEDGIVILKANIKQSETIEVISEINSKKVIGIENKAYKDNNLNRFITKKVIFPDSIKFIKSSAFAGYENISEIYFPLNLEKIDAGVFFDSKNIETLKISDNNQNYKCINNCLIDIRTKTLIMGGNKSIIPDIVEVIEKYAFKGAKKLKKLDIPNSVRVIKKYAFWGCEGLETVTLSDKLTSIDDRLFYDCINLKEIYIGSNVLEISPQSVFSNCEKLEKISISPNNPIYQSIDGCIIEKETQTLVYGVNISEIPKGVKIIGHSAFSGRNTLTSIIIGDDVEVIQASAFSDCIQLKEVIISDNVKKIDDRAFYNCTHLEKVKMPEAVDYFGKSVFYDCESLTELTLPKGITEIPDYTFSGCKKLTNLYVSTHMNRIGVHAFSSCNSFEYIDLSSTETIEKSAFSFCTSLSNINLENVKYIGDFAFNACSKLGEIYIKNTVETIGSKAFYNCHNTVLYCEDSEMKDTWAEDFSDSVKCYFGIVKGIEYENFTFRLVDEGLELINYVGNEEIVRIPEKVEGKKVVAIGTEVFMANQTLREVIFPDTIKIIKVNAFSNCINLNNVVLPSALKELEENAFSRCEKLIDIKLNEGLEVIGDYAFLMCDINSIVIPSTLKTIGHSAFSDNYRLVEIYDLSTIDIANQHSSSVGNIKDFVKEISNSIDFPTGIIDKENGLRFYYNFDIDQIILIGYYGTDCILELPEYIDYTRDGITKSYRYNINHFAFYDNDVIVKVDIPSTVRGIGEKAFFSCQNLASIIIPESIQTLGNSIFTNDNHLFEIYNLSKLELTIGSSSHGHVAEHAKYIYTSRDVKSRVIDGKDGFIYFVDGDNSYVVGYYGESKEVVLPENIQGFKYSIASSVFKDKDFTSVKLSNNIVRIEDRAFSSCKYLKEIIIPSSVKFIGKYAFYLSGLERAIFEDTNNWYAYAPQSTYVIKLDLSDDIDNASFLRNNTYYSYDWVKEENSLS